MIAANYNYQYYYHYPNTDRYVHSLLVQVHSIVCIHYKSENISLSEYTPSVLSFKLSRCLYLHSIL